MKRAMTNIALGLVLGSVRQLTDGTHAKGATIDFDSTRPSSPFLKETHHAWRRELRRFIERVIMPHVEEWEARAFLDVPPFAI